MLIIFDHKFRFVLKYLGNVTKLYARDENRVELK